MPKKHSASNKTRKRKGKDLDEIIEDLATNKRCRLMNQNVDPDLPGCTNMIPKLKVPFFFSKLAKPQTLTNAFFLGCGQFYCIECDRYFINQNAMSKHKASKG